MRLRRQTRILKDKAVASLKRATAAFNSLEEEGRQSQVLRDLQHAFEMLLKAGLSERKVPVFDKRTGQSIGFEKSVNLSREHLGLTEEGAGTLRAIDQLRDDDQHWFNDVSEGLLYAHARAAVTLFDDILKEVFAEHLVDHMPRRVLPISSEAPRDIQILIDEEYHQIAALLSPGKRQGPEARGRIRSLLAMEAHIADETIVSEKDVTRVQKAIKEGRDRRSVFPRLDGLGSEIAGDGVTVTVRFTKNSGAPVTYVSSDDPQEAAAIRELDLQKKFHWSATGMATKLGLTAPMALALRRHLVIDGDPDCQHTFRFGKTSHVQYSDNAYTRMRTALEDTAVDMDEVWQEHRPRPKK